MIRPALIVALLALLAPAPAFAGAPGTWTRLHAGNAADAEPGLARVGGQLHIVWQEASGARAGLEHQVISAGGEPASSNVVAEGWLAINPHVELASAGTQLRAVWAGTQAATQQGALVSAPATGGGWSAPTPALAAATGGSATGVGAALQDDGTLVVAQGDTAAGTNRFRVGTGAETAFETGGCCALEPDVAVDANSDKIFLAWYSSAPARRGLWTQEISANGVIGSRTRVAGSGNADGSAAIPPGQRTAITARVGAGGVFVAYGAGYPVYTTVNLLRIGRGPLAVARSDRIEHVGVAPGPEGRLWLFWSRGDSYLVTRSNRAATRFETVTRVSLPAADATTFGLYGEGSGGPLDLVAHAGSGAAIPDWHTQVLPRLSLVVTASRTTVRHKRVFRRLSLRITDAGDPVGGVRVTIAGKRFTTASSGRVTAMLPTAGRQVNATAAKTGYATTAARVRL